MLTVATVASIGLRAWPAAAHFGYHNNLAPPAATGMLQSKGYTSFGALAAEFTGLRPAGIQILANAAGATVDTPIHARAVMAGGLEVKGRSNPAIGHLDFAATRGRFRTRQPPAPRRCGATLGVSSRVPLLRGPISSG